MLHRYAVCLCAKTSFHMTQIKWKGYFIFVEVLWSSQLNGVMLSTVSFPNHTFTGQA